MVRRLFALVALAVVCVPAAPLMAQSPAVNLADHGHWKTLKPIVESRVAANPNDAEAQWLLARVWMAWKDSSTARRAGERRRALDPKSADYRWQVARSSANSLQREHLRRWPPSASSARSRRPLALNPKHTASMTGLMEYFNRAPGIVGGDKKRAAEIPAEIMAVNKVDGWIAKVRLLQQQSPVPAGEIEQAWVQAVQADPSRYEPHINLASIYTGGTTPRWELAEKEALTAKKIDPDRTTPYAVLAAVYATAERWAELDAVLAEAEKQIPDNLTPYLRASGALLAVGKDLARAERYARKYLSQEPEPNASTPAVAHWRLGLILEKEGRKPEAIAELQKATELDPKFEQAQKDLKRVKG